VLTSVVIVTVVNGVIVHSVLLTCDAALFAECFPMFLRNVWTLNTVSQGQIAK